MHSGESKTALANPLERGYRRREEEVMSDLSRRDVLRTAGALGAAGAPPPTAGPPAPAPGRAVSPTGPGPACVSRALRGGRATPPPSLPPAASIPAAPHP